MTWSDYISIVPLDIYQMVWDSLISSGGIVHHLIDEGRHITVVAWEEFRFYFLQGMS